MSKFRRIILLLLILISCVGCDQATKMIARQELASAPMQEYWNGFFRLVYAENPGAFLSMGADLHPELRFWVFTVFVALLLGGLAWFMLRYIQKTPTILVIAIALVVSGGLGNLIDRVIYDGHVVDFMQIGFYPLRTGVFNVADMAIMAGTGLIFLLSLRESWHERARVKAK
jgi:signal peptidase II